MKRTYEIDFLQTGQRRPHADHVYRAEVSVFENNAPVRWSDKVAQERVAFLVHAYKEDGEWHEPKLTKFERIEEGKWLVEITIAFTD